MAVRDQVNREVKSAYLSIEASDRTQDWALSKENKIAEGVLKITIQGTPQCVLYVHGKTTDSYRLTEGVTEVTVVDPTDIKDFGACSWTNFNGYCKYQIGNLTLVFEADTWRSR